MFIYSLRRFPLWPALLLGLFLLIRPTHAQHVPELSRPGLSPLPAAPSAEGVPFPRSQLYQQEEFSTFFTRARFHRTTLLETASLTLSFESRQQDRWLARDKVQHFVFSFLWTLSSQYTFVNKATLSEKQALPLSMGSGAIIGLSKEVYDWRVGATHYFSGRDLVVDALGILVATGLILL